MAQQNAYESTLLQTLQLEQQARAQQQEQARIAEATAAAEAERSRSRTLGEVGRDVALSASSGLGGLVGSGYGLINFATGGTLDRATGGAGSQAFKDWEAAMAEGQSAPLQARRENVMGAFQGGIGSGLAEAVTTPSVLADMAIQSLPYFVPGLGAAGVAARTTQAGALARGASEAAAGMAAGTSATRAALAANAATMGGMGNVDAINEARAAGLGENDVQLAGIGGFAANALLSYGTNKLLGTAALEAGVAQRAVGAGGVGQAGNVAAQVGLGALREGTQEAIEEAGQTAISNVAGQRPIEEGTGTAAALGGLLGGAFGAAFGAANVRKPTQTREQIQALQTELEAELDGLGMSTGPRPLDSIMRARQRAGEVQAQIDANPEIQDALGRQALPEVRYAEEIDLSTTSLPEFDQDPGTAATILSPFQRNQLRGMGVTDAQLTTMSAVDAAAMLQGSAAEEINLGAVPPPGLTGLNAIVAQQRAQQAQQPPRMGVQELSFDQYTGATEQEVAGLPQVDEIAGRSVQDIIRETAPIERVAQQFGPAVAGAEAARRAAAAEVPVAPVQAPDLSTPKAVGEFRKSVRQALIAKTGMTPSSARGEYFTSVLDAVVARGIAPGTPEFDTAVQVETARAVDKARAENTESAPLGALSAAYQSDLATVEGRVDAAFDRGGVATTEEELFGAAAASADATPNVEIVPASDVKATKPGQVWVDPTGAEYTVDRAIAGGTAASLLDATGAKTNRTLAQLRNRGWTMRATPAVAGLNNESVAQLRNLLSGTYWAERGGRLLRAQGDTGPVVGRTEWLSSIPEVQAVLSNTGYNAADVQGWLDRAATGQGRPLGDKQVAIIEGLLDVMSQPQVEADVASQQADAATPKQVTAAAPRYDAQAWADYMTYPGAAHLNALVEMKGQEGHPQPVLAGMLFGIDIAGDLAELNPLVMAAQAHPEFALMSQDSRSEVTTHIAQAVNRVTGATFELADTVPVRQRQVDTPEFKRWFGDSKVVGANGSPLVVYHGTASDFSEFDPSIGSSGNTGLYFTTSIGYANASAEVAAAGGYSALVAAGGLDAATQAAQQAGTVQPANIIPAYLRMERPFDMRKEPGVVTRALAAIGVGRAKLRQDQALRDDLPMNAIYVGPSVKAELEKAGYDGVITSNGVYVVFKPTQIKSAIGNTGAFDPSNPDIRFAQGTATKAMNKRVFDRAIATAKGNIDTPLFGVDTIAELQALSGVAPPSNVKGMFHNGNIYIVRENIANGKDMALTLAHELGHSGLGALLGTSLNAATNRMWANADMRGRIRSKMADLKMAQGTEAERRASRTLAAEEVLADMLASGERLNKDIWSKLRAGVRDFFARVFGVRDYVVSNKEVDALLSDVAKVIKGAPAAQVRGDMANADMWLVDPAAAASADPKFSKVQSDLDEVLAKAQAEPNKQVIPLADITKAAGEASAGVGRQVWNAIKENKLGELYTKYAMHLNQLKDWYDPLFGGRIGVLANAKRAKEAFFNQSLTRPVDLEYDGEKLGAASILDVAGEWTKFSRENPQKHNALNHMKQYSTFYKVFPDKSWEDQRDIDYAAAGYTAEERQAEHARLQKAYQAIGPRGQEIYKKAQAIYKKQWDRHHAVLLAELRRVGKAHQESVQQDDGTIELIQKYESDVRTAMQRISEGPYSPLQRNGEYNVTVWKDNTVAYFAAYDTRQDAEIARKQINENFERTGETGATVNIGGRKDFSLQIDSAGNRGTLEQLTAKIAADLNGVIPAGMEERSRNKMLRALTNSLTESYLQSLPQNAFMQHARTRKNVGGFDMDAMRSFADYTLRSSRTTAGVKYDGVIGSAMTAIDTYVADVGKGLYAEDAAVKNTDTDKLQSIANAVKHQHQASLDVDRSDAARGVMQVSFMYYMTSLSQMFLNASQTYMVALPRLAARYGVAAATREVNKAAGQYFKSGFDLLKEGSVINKAAATDAGESLVAGVLTALYEDGTLDFTQAHDLADVAGGAFTMLSPYRRAAAQMMSVAMHKSEVFNRQVTSVAAARLEMQKLKAAGQAIPAPGTKEHTALQTRLADVGRNAIDTTHFDYSQNNKPAIMQGDVGALALQFQQFRFHMLAMIGKDIRDGAFGTDPEVKAEARRALSYIVGMQLAFTGVAGTIMAPIIFGLMDAFKDDDDLTTSRQDFLNYFGEYATHGALAGVIDTQRIASDSLITFGGQYAPIGGSPSETAQHYVLQNLGPSAGLIFDMLDGAAAVANGDVYDASQKLLPKPFKDALKATKESMYGAANANKIVYHEPSVLSTITQSIGLRSAERRDIEGMRGAVYRANKTAYDLKDRYLTRMAVAYTTGDQSAIAGTQADIQDWNQRYPDFAIKAQDMARAVTTRARQEVVAAQTGIVSSRMPGPTIDAVLGR